MRGFFLYLLIPLSVFISAGLQASELPGQKGPFSIPIKIRTKDKKSCVIGVHYLSQAGRTEFREYRVKLNTIADCRKLAKLHQKNFNPAATRQKVVRYQWQN